MAPIFREDLMMATLSSGIAVSVPEANRSRGAIGTQLPEENLEAAVQTLPKIQVNAVPTAPKPALTNPLKSIFLRLTPVVIDPSLTGKFTDEANQAPERFRLEIIGKRPHAGSRNSVGYGDSNPLVTK
jgi:hypothetical protein